MLKYILAVDNEIMIFSRIRKKKLNTSIKKNYNKVIIWFKLISVEIDRNIKAINKNC